MGGAFQPQNLFGGALMLAMGMLAIFAEAAPMGLAADARPSPDIVFCIVACWSLRRPAAAALPVVFALGLARDLLTDVPTGIGALSLVLASEYLRLFSPLLARRNFATEWAAIALFLALSLALQWLTVLILLAHPPYLSDLGLQWALSIGIYPLVALLLRGLFGIGWQKPDPARG